MYISERERESEHEIKYTKKGAIHMIIICTTLIRENTPGVFVENAAIACWFSLLSHIQLTLMTMMTMILENAALNDERENAQHVSSFSSIFLFACCALS